MWFTVAILAQACIIYIKTKHDISAGIIYTVQTDYNKTIKLFQRRMFTPFIRSIIVLAGLFMAFLFYRNGDVINTLVALGGVGLIIWGYFKSGTVYLAFQQLKKENYAKAEALLSRTRNPAYLQRSQKSYYYFVKGFIELRKEHYDTAYTDLQAALTLGMRTQNDMSIVILNLAYIELERDNLTGAKNFLERTKVLDHKPEVTTEIRRLEEKIHAARENG